MKYEKAYLESLLEFSKKDPALMAELAGGVCPGGDSVEISFMGQLCRVAHPDGKIELPAWPDLHHEEQILILQYLAGASGLPCRSSWLSFLDLPGGPHHFVPFQKEALIPLAKAFANQPHSFLPAAKSLGGVQIDLGHLGAVLPVFPRLPLAVLLWTGDDEFPASANILFDAVAQTYLSTASLYVLGIAAAKRMVGAAAAEWRLG
ncbi:MAG: DUF3786 domain-containing protein [Dethiobacter sp.]|jgi:hypothetical protein|nr:DUF3786 domain-containing protein [Dethiobacter sp.]MBS3898814.1 DUF3786 domain-containing protein [Dethiobacter sp.]MBS3983343.1 DUF3786 domain-containing protein [Dethiobacter sp.]MCL4462501.1 DUF3786 domain-containing protein [Bacillota bacterium]MCL5993274.1 DUF3786 domain-containing protein [Bacillota bacterium]